MVYPTSKLPASPAFRGDRPGDHRHPEAASEHRRRVVDACMAAKVRVLTIPPANDWINGQLSAGRIQEVRIEDLLGRAAIQLDDAQVRSHFAGRRVLITGAMDPLAVSWCGNWPGWEQNNWYWLTSRNRVCTTSRPNCAAAKDQPTSLLAWPMCAIVRPWSTYSRLRATGGLPRRRLQACSADGGPTGRGGPHEHPRNTYGRRTGLHPWC